MISRPSVLAAAVCSLLAASSAIAQSSNVQLYGRANLGLDNYEATGARDATATGANCTAGTAGCTAGSDINRESRFRVFDNSSRVGLRGTEDLGNGLRAIFQIETGVNVDNGSNTGQGGQGNGSTGFWASRDSYVGLDSNWGRLTFGRQSVYYQNGVNAQFASNYVNTEVPWTDGRAFGRINAPGAGRLSNTVYYTTPTFAGLNGSLYYSPNAQEAVQTNPPSEANGYIWGATARGTWGPFYAQLDYVSLEGNTPSSGVRQDASGWKLGTSWGYMPGARIGLIGTLTYDNVARGLTPGDKVDQWGWTINWEHTFGNFQLLAQYGQISNLKSCDSDSDPGNVSCGDSGARAFMVGGRYFMSKRTWVYASYNGTWNKSNQFADYTNSGYTSVNGAPFPYGADPQVWALGLLHNF